VSQVATQVAFATNERENLLVRHRDAVELRKRIQGALRLREQRGCRGDIQTLALRLLEEPLQDAHIDRLTSPSEERLESSVTGKLTGFQTCAWLRPRRNQQESIPQNTSSMIKILAYSLDVGV
jgi:hypothetical protein